ncbi:MAG TPA: site-specific integrase, partial [Planctomycetota bacterium]|nr:site-specific integrase [Planctomycetota bacterium]
MEENTNHGTTAVTRDPDSTPTPEASSVEVPESGDGASKAIAIENDQPEAREEGETAPEAAPASAPPADIDFERAFVDYLRYERNMSPETIRAYEKDLHQFLRFFARDGGRV